MKSVKTTEQPSDANYLSESQLIKKMEKYGIGTNALMPSHIKTIIDRGYVTMVGQNRRLKHTDLGIAFA